MSRPKKQINDQEQPIIEEVADMSNIGVNRYKIIKKCFVCNFGHSVGDIINKEQALLALKNDGMIKNFINSGYLELL